MIYRGCKLSASFVVAAVLTASAAWANEPVWQEIANGPEVIVEVDTANIRVREARLTAWVRFTTPRDMDTGGIKFRSAVSLSVFDCDANKSGRSSTTVFAGPRGEGKIVHTEEGLSVSMANLRYERPGTSGYEVLKFVCGRPQASALRETEAEPTRTQNEIEHKRDTQPGGTPARITRPANPDDYYPPGSSRRAEEGAPVVLACVGQTGNLLRMPIVTDTSGFPDLDGAAIKVAMATRYAAGKENGAALPESCIKFKVRFTRKR